MHLRIKPQRQEATTRESKAGKRRRKEHTKKHDHARKTTTRATLRASLHVYTIHTRTSIISFGALPSMHTTPRRSRSPAPLYPLRDRRLTLVASARQRRGLTAMEAYMAMISSRNVSVMGTDRPSGIMTCGGRRCLRGVSACVSVRQRVGVDVLLALGFFEGELDEQTERQKEIFFLHYIYIPRMQRPVPPDCECSGLGLAKLALRRKRNNGRLATCSVPIAVYSAWYARYLGYGMLVSCLLSVVLETPQHTRLVPPNPDPLPPLELPHNRHTDASSPLHRATRRMSFVTKHNLRMMSPTRLLVASHPKPGNRSACAKNSACMRRRQTCNAYRTRKTG